MAVMTPFFRQTSIPGVASFMLFSVARIAEASVITTAPRDALTIVNCDGGHGVFTCSSGQKCFFDQEGRFGCCTASDLKDCQAPTSCYGKNEERKSCDTQKEDCITCTDKRDSQCLTVFNTAENIMGIVCSTTPGHLFTSFELKSRQFTWPTPTSISSATDNRPTTVATVLTTSTSDLKSTTRATTTTPQSSGSTTQTTNTGLPLHTSRPPNGNIAAPLIGGITVGVLAGSALLTLVIFLLHKWYRGRQQTADFTFRGLLPGPRRQIDTSAGNPHGPHDDGQSNRSEEVSNTGTHVYERDSSSVYSAAPTYSAQSSPSRRTSQQSAVFSTNRPYSAEPRSQSDPAYELPYPSSAYSRQTADERSEGSPNFSRPIALHRTLRSPPSPSSPPYTPTPTPRSPIFSLYPRNHSHMELSSSPSHRSSTRTENWPLPRSSLPPVPDEDREQRRKSSQLLPMAGPYLSADAAMGEGYWEAEREQLEADKRVGRSRESGEDEGMEDFEKNERSVEDEGGDVEDFGGVALGQQGDLVEVNETGTVVRYGGRS